MVARHLLDCPVCRLDLVVVEFTDSYVIFAREKAVSSCPDCQTPLEFQEGEVVESKEEPQTH